MERLFFDMMRFYSGNPGQIQHFTKVHSYARHIGLSEKIDAATLQILEIAAVVHDIGIKPALEKYGSANGKYQESEGPPVAEAMLRELAYPQDVIDRVCYLVGHHHTYTDIDGIEYQILVEADFLVNMHEGEMDPKTIESTMINIFRTQTGKEYCRVMFDVQ